MTSDVLAYNYERLFGSAAAVPVGRRLLPPRLLPVPGRRDAAADPRTRRGPRPQRADRRADRHAGAGDAAVGLSDLPLRQRPLDVACSRAWPRSATRRWTSSSRRARAHGRRQPPPRAGVRASCSAASPCCCSATPSTAGGCSKATSSRGAGDDGGLGGLLHAARHRRDAPLDAPALRARAREPRSTLTRARLALLACASLTVPLVIVVRRALGEHVDLYVLVGASAAMFALVLLRMAGHRAPPRGADRPRGGAADRAGRTERCNRRSEERLGVADQELLRRRLHRSAPTARAATSSPSVAQTLGHDPAALDRRASCSSRPPRGRAAPARADRRARRRSRPGSARWSSSASPATGEEAAGATSRRSA